MIHYDELLNVSLHEAGHAVVAWEFGCRVREIRLTADGGGAVVPGAPPVRPEAEILALAAGAASERLLGSNPMALPSLEDSQLAWRAEARLPYILSESQRRGLIGRAESLVFQRQAEIRYLAAELRDRRRLDAQALATLVHQPASRLGRYRGLYPKPVPIVPKRPAPAPAAAPRQRAVVLSWPDLFAQLQFGPQARTVSVGCGLFG